MARTLAGIFCALAIPLGSCGESDGSDSRPPLPVVWSSATLGPVEARVRGPEGPFRFGERIPLELVVEVGPDARLEPIEVGARLGHLRIRDRQQRKLEGALVHRFEVDNERSSTNLAIFPALAFEVIAGEGKGERHVLQLPTAEFEFTALDASERPDLESLAKPLDPVPLPADSKGPQRWWWAAAILAVLGLALGLMLRRRRPSAERTIEIDPEEEAHRALEALLTSGRLDRGEIGEFYVELTRIVRVFLERTTGIHAPELTTEEFLVEASRDGSRIDASRRFELSRFLESADLIKYAAQRPEPAEIHAAVDAARSFCRRGPIVVPEEAD